MTSERETTFSVLIVDREPEVLILLSSILQSYGYRTLLARSVPEALEIMRRRYVPVDLILCNAGIDRTIARDLPAALREIRPGLPAVWMSVFVDAGIVRIGLARNAPNGPMSLPDMGLPDEETPGFGRADHGLIAAIHAALSAPEAGSGVAN
jgi:CheY-like chemotaxis protein